MPTHNFNNKDAPMTFCRRVELIECVARRIDCRVEAKCDYGSLQVVIDGFRYANQRYALFVQFLGDAQRAVSADNDQTVQFQFAKIGDDGIGDITFDSSSSFSEDRIAKRIGRVGRAEDRTAEMKNTGDTGHVHRPGSTMDEAIEALFNSEG